MATTTRTIGPLHFEDLDPHRFEDLARLLIHDFRNWSHLEPLGRTGNDDGFDIRGIEIATSESTDDGGEEQDDIPGEERQWLVQCKRENKIPPKKMAIYATEITKHENLHGVLFITSANLTKASREVLYNQLRASGIKEIYIWAAGELEDQLYQEENDRLLFAFFGISLSARRRSSKTKVRQRLAAKRKARKAIPDDAYQPVFIRLPDDESWPTTGKSNGISQMWRGLMCIGHYYDGLVFYVRTYHAWVDDKREYYDFEERLPHDAMFAYLPGSDRFNRQIPEEKIPRDRVLHFINQMPEKNSFTMRPLLLLRYDQIIDIDTDGDDHSSQNPIIYADLDYRDGKLMMIEGAIQFQPKQQFGELLVEHELKGRIKHFPKKYSAVPTIPEPEIKKIHAEPPKEEFPDLKKQHDIQ
jgi:hypothetical protein